MATVFLTPDLNEDSFAKLLAKDFKRYKEGEPVEYMSMGKDVPFHYPQSAVMAELQHVHIMPIESKSHTSDEFIVYTRGFSDPDKYLILAILSPNAHEQSRNVLLMSAMADVAEHFRNKF